MADYALPTLTSTYSDLVDLLKARDVSAMKLFDGTTDSNLPSGTKRWNSTNNNFEKFNGSTWSPLAAKYMINVDLVDGCTVNDGGSTTSDLWTASKITTQLGTKLDSSTYTAADVLTKIKTVDGSGSGLDADLLDGMNATSTNTASSVVVRDASGNFSAGTITAALSGNASSATRVEGLDLKYLVPSGGIIMWSGAVASIPAGWYLCNGANGTPNLMDRFIVGAGSSYAVGATGGSADAVVVSHSHTASTDSQGSHAHSAWTDSQGSHTHSISNSWVGSFYYGDGQGNANNGNSVGTKYTDAAGAHGHNIGMDAQGAHGHNIAVSTNGESGTNKNLPPYYALCYIMKT